MSTTTNQTQPQRTIGKGQFRCFKCREVFAAKDGDWYHWSSMQVHLCKSCERETRDSKERKTR